MATYTAGRNADNKTPKMLKAQLHDTSSLLLFYNVGLFRWKSYFTFFVETRDVNMQASGYVIWVSVT